MTTAEIQGEVLGVALDLYRLQKRLEDLAEAVDLPGENTEQSLEFDLQGCISCSGDEVGATAKRLHESALMTTRKLAFKCKQSTKD